jgi:hypothetical protein
MLREIFDACAYIIGWLLARPTLRVRLIADDPEQEVGGLQVEVENRRDKATSLDPTVRATFLTVKRQHREVNFDVRELDRNLPPFTPKLFSASARERQPERFDSWFRVYRFSPSRGRVCKLRIKNASLEPMNLVAYWAQRLAFRFFIFGLKTSTTPAEYRASERARGPH